MNRIAPRGFHFYEGEATWRFKGVAYPPQRPDAGGDRYPVGPRTAEDLAAIASIGANGLRLYDLPGEAFARAAEAAGLRLLVDVPWPKHLALYGDRRLEALTERAVVEAVERLGALPAVFGVLLGNEIPPDLIRWAGPRRVSAWLRRLYGRARSVARGLPIGFATFPSAEYLHLPFFDFLGFNVYLHDPGVFREYLVRLRHLYPERPVLLSELGVDAWREGEERQADLLRTHLETAFDVGLAGTVVFAWTDQWHTGGHEIEDWAFGLTDRDRRPRPALQAVADVFAAEARPADVRTWPSASVIVPTYNGARTLRACLTSLRRLTYPNYETIVVVDGSTDATEAILADFPEVRVHRQANLGLSSARNAGVALARGEIIAFTDDDCRADPDWLRHLVLALERQGADGAGGPNLTPEAPGIVAGAIALAPGHAAHVLLSPTEAEHVPGCNMAFRREVLLRLEGFDPLFRKAGDDVDFIWRLQEAGRRVVFSTAAFVWHHRRATVGAYLRQQIGYGEAEALLLRKHPHRFNDRGQSLWRGVIYGGGLGRSPLGGRHVHYGVFGSAGYQCLYARPTPGWVHAVVSPEAWLLFLALILAGLFAPAAFRLGLAGVAVSLAVSGLQAWAAWKASGPAPLRRLGLLWGLWVAQPLLRGSMRFVTLLKPRGTVGAAWPRPAPEASPVHDRARRLDFWGEAGASRLDVLRRLTERMRRWGWIHAPNLQWEPWDLTVLLSWWYKLRIVSAEEDHGAGRRRLLVRLKLLPTTLQVLFWGAAGLVCLAVGLKSTVVARLLAVGFLLVAWALFVQALAARRGVVALLEAVAGELAFNPVRTRRRREPGRPPTPAAPEPRQLNPEVKTP